MEPHYLSLFRHTQHNNSSITSIIKNPHHITPHYHHQTPLQNINQCHKPTPLNPKEREKIGERKKGFGFGPYSQPKPLPKPHFGPNLVNYSITPIKSEDPLNLIQDPSKPNPNYSPISSSSQQKVAQT
jgi:hypothetical protein